MEYPQFRLKHGNYSSFKSENTYTRLWETRSTYEFECRSHLEKSGIEEMAELWGGGLLTVTYWKITNRDLDVVLWKLSFLETEISRNQHTEKIISNEVLKV